MTDLEGNGVRVLVAGTASHVPGSPLPAIRAVAASVDAVRDCFVNVCGIAAANVTTVLDPPDPEALLDAVLTTASEASDTLIVYYVGHGLRHPDTFALHLATYATENLSRKANFQALAYSELVTALNDCRARKIVVVLDCCYSGNAQVPVRTGALLASADPNEQAWAVSGERYTAFTAELLDALHRGISTGPRLITLSSLCAHLRRVMARKGRPAPSLYTGSLVDGLVLAHNGAYAPGAGVETVDPPWEGDCPYRGLDAYTAEDSTVFRGRAALVGRALDRLSRAARDGGTVIVVGPSGCGKSSLLSAGVLPAIRRGDLGVRGSSAWPTITFTPGTDPLRALAEQLSSLDKRTDADVAMADLRAGRGRELAQRVLTSIPAVDYADDRRIVVIVDQFEEIFAPEIHVSDCATFVQELAAMTVDDGADHPIALVIVSLRSDFVGSCARYTELVAALERNQVVASAMTTSGLRAAIEEPAELAGLRIAPGLTELLLRDTGANLDDDNSAEYDPGALPLLSHALLSVWQRRSGGNLTVEAYRETGGVAGAVAATADKTYASLEPSVQVAARRLMVRMVRVSEDAPDTRRRIPLADLSIADKNALNAFTRARLCTVDGQSAEITHEALIRSWPRLQGWVATDRETRMIAQEIETRATAWRSNANDADQLYRGGQLARALPLAAALDADLSARARSFLTASERAANANVRRWRVITAVLAVLVLGAGTLAFVAFDRGNRLDSQLAIETAENLGQAALARGPDDPVFATKLAMAAWRSDPANPTARTALAMEYRAMQSVTAVYSDLIDKPVEAIGLSDDGQTLMLARTDEAVVVTGFDGAAPSRWTLPAAPQPAIYRLSPDGRQVVGLSSTGDVLTWDTSTHTGPTLQFRARLDAKSDFPLVSFSADSRELTVVDTAPGAGLELAVWDLASRRRVAGLDHLPDSAVQAAVLTADRSHVAVVTNTSGADTQIVVRSLADGAVLRTYSDASVVLHGRAVATCDEGAAPFDRNDDIVLYDPLTGIETARRPLGGNSVCTELLLTRDAEHVVEGEPLGAPPLVADARMVTLDTGEVSNFEVPATRDNSRLSDDGLLGPDRLMAAQEHLGRPPTVVVARGTTVLRLATVPDPGSGVDNHRRQESSAGDPAYIVDEENDQATNRSTYISRDADSGREIARVVIPEDDVDSNDTIGFPQVEGVFDREVLRLFRSHGLWRMTRYTLPDLRTTGPVTISDSSVDVPSDVAEVSTRDDGNRILVLADGRLTDWDATTMTPRGEPLPLGSTDADRDALRQAVHSVPRPSHADELVVHSAGPDVSVWDISGRRRIEIVHTDLPADADDNGLAVDPSGRTLAILAAGELHVASLDAGSTSRPPIPAPDVSSVLGFTADGYLITETTSLNLPQVQLWDLDRGVVSGAMSLDTLIPSAFHDVGDMMDLEGPVRHPLSLPLAPQRWLDGLCSTGIPDFTAAEKAALPPGSPDLPPLCP